MYLYFSIFAALSMIVGLFLLVALAYPLNKRLDPFFKNVRYLPAEYIEGYWFEPAILFIPKCVARSCFYMASAALRNYRILNCKPMNVRSHLPIWLAHACDIAVGAGLITLVCTVIVLVISFIDFFRVHWFKIAPILGS